MTTARQWQPAIIVVAAKKSISSLPELECSTLQVPRFNANVNKSPHRFELRHIVCLSSTDLIEWDACLNTFTHLASNYLEFLSEEEKIQTNMLDSRSLRLTCLRFVAREKRNNWSTASDIRFDVSRNDEKPRTNVRAFTSPTDFIPIHPSAGSSRAFVGRTHPGIYALA